MRPLVFLFPHNRMDVGGNTAQIRFVEACSRFTSTTIAYYGEKRQNEPHLDDYLTNLPRPGDPIFIIHWGPDIGQLLQRLTGRDVIYVAHSTGWNLDLPPHVPILCVSRHTMAYWGRRAPASYIAYLPNVVETDAVALPDDRDVDVLVQVRKTSPYVLDRLVPALQAQCRVHVLDGWVDDLSSWFRRAKVYLYDSLEHWIDLGATEGFGLPPLEAMSHGCVVFSSVNDALADYLDPAFNCRKIRVHSLSWDVKAVVQAVEQQAPSPPTQSWFAGYSPAQVSSRLEVIVTNLHDFFDHARSQPTDIDDVWAVRRPTTLQRAKKAVKLFAGR